MNRIISLCILFLAPVAVLAFDDDFSLTPPALQTENFLDIKAYEFQPNDNRLWWNSDNGFRLTGGSLDKERAYTELDFRLTEQLSRRLSATIMMEQKNFHAPKPQDIPMAELGMKLSIFHIGFLGTPIYDKRQADLGWSVRVGDYGRNYLRASYIRVDHYYNKKNDYDNSRYLDTAQEWRLQGHYAWDATRIAFDLQQTPDFRFSLDNGRIFDYRSWQIKFIGEYAWQNKFLGMVIAGDAVNKNMQQIQQDEYKQKFRQFDVYVDGLKAWGQLLTLGLRFDELSFSLDRHIDVINKQTNHLHTTQIYGITKIGQQRGFYADVGIYLGHIHQKIDDDVNTNINRNLKDWQAKLRTGLVAQSNKGKLVLNISYNLDDIIKDPLDGGGISYQRQFD